jgi:hypothetical protein
LSGDVFLYDLKNLGKIRFTEMDGSTALRVLSTFERAAFTAGSISVQFNEFITLEAELAIQDAFCIDTPAPRKLDWKELAITKIVTMAADLQDGIAIVE